MVANAGNLIWVDLEMTGLDPEQDVIIEIATVVTDTELNIKDQLPAMAISRDKSLFAKMDDWNKEHHTKSGLWQEVITSTISEEKAEQDTLDFISQYCKRKESPLCGNSVWQDRRFLARYMKRLDDHLHYRLVDVSTIKELGSYWYPQVKKPTKSSAHRAMDDIVESIEELKFYREHYFSSAKLPSS